MGLNLSGYLPGGDHDGLTPLAGKLIDEHERSYREAIAPDLGTAYVIGIVRTNSVKYPRAESEKPPTVEVRFQHIEVATSSDDLDALQAMITRLAENRRGDVALPFDDAGEPEQRTFVDDEGRELPDPSKVAEPVRPGDVTYPRAHGFGSGGQVPDPASNVHPLRSPFELRHTDPEDTDADSDAP